MAFQTYLDRFFIHPLSKVQEIPPADAYIIVPVYAEDLLEKLCESLNNCHPPAQRFNIIWVINSKISDNAFEKNKASQNLEFLTNFPFQSDKISSIILDARNLEEKNAGVGLARKIGMDAVIHSLKNDKNNPWLICLDADCQVSTNYFQKLEHTLISSNFQIATIEFQHPFWDEKNKSLQQGILQYELFLEYYRAGLQKSGFPFFFHTVGSSMACRAVPYAKCGGMNQRKAGEDFYFLHKLFPHYPHVEIPGPLVFPSTRISERVPFGTGRFQKKWVENNEHQWITYHPEIFQFLKTYLSESMTYLKENENEPPFVSFKNTSKWGLEWLETSQSELNLMQAKNASPNQEQRRKAFFRFFDGFMALRFVHFFHSKLPALTVEEAVEKLIPDLQRFPTIPEKIRWLRIFLASQ